MTVYPSVNIFSYAVYANLEISILLLKLFASANVFRIRLAPDIYPTKMGFNVTLPAIVLVAIKLTKPILHAKSSFVEILISLLEQSIFPAVVLV